MTAAKHISSPFASGTFLAHPHACIIFDDLKHYRELAFSFIRDGLAGNEKCIMAVDTYTPQMIRADFTSAGMDLKSHIERGEVTIIDVRSSYGDAGGFDPNQTIETWKKETTQALSQAFSGLRVVGEATFSLGGEDLVDKLIYYENIINEVLFNRYPFKSLCVYERKLYSPKVIKTAIRAHPMLFYNDKLFEENIHYIPPEIHFKDETARDEIDIMLRNIEHHNANLVALKESEAKFRMMFEKAPLSYQSLDEDGNFIEVNENWLKILGYRSDEVVGRNFSEFLHPDWKAHFRENFPRFKAVGEVLGVEFEMVKKDGSLILVSFHGRIGKNLDNSFSRTHCIFQDITARKRSEKKVLHQKQAITLNNKIANVFLTSSAEEIFADTLEVILETVESPFGYFGYIDEEGSLCCPSMTRNIWEKCQIPDKCIVFPKETWAGLWGQALTRAETMISNQGLSLPLGHIQLHSAMAVPILLHGKLIGQFVVADREGGYGPHEQYLLESAASQTAPILNNLLEKEARDKQHKALQARVEQAQKMEAIGSLAGGIAHDFNNILFPIIGMAELLIEDLPEKSLERESAKEIYRAGNRAGDLVRQILAFSRQSELQMMPVRFQKVLREVLKLCRSTIPTNIEIVQEIQQDCGAVWANATQLHQIAMNLITNAYHAVQDRNGRISVALKEVAVEPDDLDTVAAASGKCLMLSVSDNGQGMAPGTMKKIFDPYFTTKKQGQGTGLGLAVVYGIVREYRGDIKVCTDPGSGSVFTIYLPVMAATPDEELIKETPEIQTGTERILLVDDEPAIASLESQMLERLGYAVTLRLSGVEALEVFKADPLGFDMVISDMSMPNITGDQLAGELKKTRPDIPIVICTGFSERINQENARAAGVDGFLMKPITKSDLAGMVREVLDRAKRPTR